MSFFVSLVKPIAYISLPVILYRSLAGSSPTVKFYGRLGIYVGTMMSVAACSAFIAAGLNFFGNRFDTNYFVARTFHAIVKKTLGLQVELEGEEILGTRPAVLMLNHQSMLDILIVGR
jgi:lysophosphatidate acyltransferase